MIVLLVHPVLLVVPRFFEAGATPVDAFITIITTYASQGVLLGIIAWCLMLVLGITSLARKKPPMKYTTWRIFHGVLAILLVSVAVWHAIDLGRHSSFIMSSFITILTASGIMLFFKTYALQISKETSEE